MAKKTGGGMTVDEARSLELENGDKFDKLPASLREQVYSKNATLYRRKIRIYGRRLWRNETIYCSAQPVSNIPLCVNHLRRALAKLCEVSGVPDAELGVPEWATQGGKACADRADELRAAMLIRGGRRADAARLVSHMARTGMLWNKGETIAGMWAKIEERKKGKPMKEERTEYVGPKAAAKKSKKGAQMEEREIAGIVFCKDALGLLTYDTGDGKRLLMEPPDGLRVPDGKTAEEAWRNKLPGLKASDVWVSLCMHHAGDARMDVASLCEYLAGRDPDMPGLNTKAAVEDGGKSPEAGAVESWKPGDVWTDPENGKRYLAKAAKDLKTDPCEVCAMRERRERCATLAKQPAGLPCALEDVILEEIEKTAEADRPSWTDSDTGKVYDVKPGECTDCAFKGVKECPFGTNGNAYKCMDFGPEVCFSERGIPEPGPSADEEPRPVPAETWDGHVWQVRTEGLEVWEGNTRSHAPQGIAELADSVKASGILEPLLGRPKRGYAETKSLTVIEIVCGRRRLAAARVAGLETVPVYVRSMDDKQAAVAVASENMQREDLSPLGCEEAVRPVVDACAGDCEEAAELLGKPVRWVKRAHSLARLVSVWRVAAMDRGLGFAFLAMLARLPEELQELFAAQYLERLAAGGGDLKMLGNMTAGALAEIPACAWMKSDRLCRMCTRRSDLQAELFDDLGTSARCLDPVCREEKRLAYVSSQKVAAAKAAKIEVAAVAVTDWTKTTDSRKQTAAASVPVVVDKGAESGTVVWREPPAKRTEAGGRRTEAGLDATPKGPTPEDRKRAAYVRDTLRLCGVTGFLACWYEKATTLEALAAAVLFGIAADDCETAGRAREFLKEMEEGATIWAGALIEGIGARLKVDKVSECEEAHAWAQLVRETFGIPE